MEEAYLERVNIQWHDPFETAIIDFHRCYTIYFHRNKSNMGHLSWPHSPLLVQGLNLISVWRYFNWTLKNQPSDEFFEKGVLKNFEKLRAPTLNNISEWLFLTLPLTLAVPRKASISFCRRIYRNFVKELLHELQKDLRFKIFKN